ncbi:MAG: topoisomerase DNA binding C4 zinc finger [Candidatus Nanosalina sp. J07AB43]|nr:MAG: topoisomerase DNA binding C4 zinc finger [Candidatus Nanosalina sp. J07AB43]
MSNRKYSDIIQEEFEQALSETDVDFERKDYPWSGELIYEAKSEDDTFTLRVYSSLDKRTGEARSRGSDAIRTVVLHTDSGRPVLKEKRTNRIQTWKKNLKKKINKLAKQQGNVKKCEECGNTMVIRENSNGEEFYGCSWYPNCKNTESL